MTIIFTESFDWTTSVSDLTKKWTTVGNAGLTSLQTGVNNKCVAINAGVGGLLSKTFIMSGSTSIIGFRFKVTRYGEFHRQQYNGNTQIKIDTLTTGIISVSNGATVIGTSVKNINFNEWYYLELKTVFNNTTGSIELRINDEVWITSTNVNTDRANVGLSNQFQIVGPSSLASGYYYADDVYVCDGSGSTNNDFLGDSAIYVMRPDGDSSPLQWTPSTGSTHYNLVSKAAFNTTTYVSDSTPGNRDQYTVENLAFTPIAIHAVAYHVIADKDEAGARGIKLYVDSGASEALSSQFYLSQDTPLDWQYIVETDPATGVAWTKAGVDAMELGVETV